MASKFVINPWSGPEQPTREAILAQFSLEGLDPTWWSNGPLDLYPSHQHPFHKVLYVLFGSITFGIAGQQVTLRTGDRLDLPPGIVHDARVGEAGVVCLEARIFPH